MRDGRRMNYSNCSQRLRPRKPAPAAASESIFSIETDKRRTHLRVRKVATLARRALRPLGLAVTACWLAGQVNAATFVIETNAVDLPFQVSFRDIGLTGPFDESFTTYFGWTGNNTGGSGDDALDDFGFDGSATPGPPLNLHNDERIYAPPVIVGVGGFDGSISQVEDVDILATSNNVFAGNALTGEAISANLTLEIPTNGVVGLDGFTTIIIQGIGSVTNTNPTNLFPVPGVINGISPDYVTGLNAIGRLQWWAKYQIPGNQTSYTVNLFLAGGSPTEVNPISIRELVVDTQFSMTGYAEDIALVPEPSSFAALLGGAGALGMGRRRRVL